MDDKGPPRMKPQPMMRPVSDRTEVFDPDDPDAEIQHAPEARAPKGDTSPLGLPVAFGHYQVTGVLGEGGMGVVYRARGRGETEFAVKVMSDKHAQKPALVRRFMREFRILQQLDHPNIARAISAGRQDDQIFFAMEYVPGPSLDDLIEKKSLDLDRTLRVIREACLGLAHAHESGVIHRDIKPANLIVRADGGVTIIDFGIAKTEDDEGELDLEATRKKNVTLEGCVMGTPYYMSPEQGKSLRDCDHRTDIYAIGICLYEMISGRTPSGLLSPDAVPEDLGHIIGKATAYNREKRYAHIRELVADLDAYIERGAAQSDAKALSAIEDSARMREIMIRMLFPKERPELPGLELATLYLPAAGVGGNYYDFIDIDGTAVGLLVGNLGQRPDAESMIFLAMVRSAFRLCARGERDPAVALALTNDFIAREQMDCFAVFSYAIIDPEELTLRVATAGFRPSGILRHGSETFDVIETPGLGLGIVEGADYESVKINLEPRDVVVFTSMGVVKTTDREGVPFGQERLDAVIRLNREQSAEDIVAAVKQRILRYSGGVAQADDMTVCVLKVP